MAEDKTQKPKPPKGTAPKGGTRYPRYGLKEAVEWAKKLVSKTHTSPQPADIVYASVVDSKGPRGEIKVSALKQFGLLDGPKNAYVATDLAKAIAVAPAEELQALYRQAALGPSLFKALFETYHGDEVSLSKLRQRAAELQVHPDNLASAVSIYAASLALAGLATIDGDKLAHQPAAAGAPVAAVGPADGDENSEEQASADALEERGGADDGGIEVEPPLGGTPRAVFHVNVNLDASLDTEKLERQLALLKRFGAI